MSQTPTPPDPSSPQHAGGSGLPEHTAGALAYLCGALTGVLFLALGGLALWVFLMLKAVQGEEWPVPLIGEQVRRYMGGVGPGGA